MSKAYVDPTAVIDDGVILGDGTKVWHFVHIMSGARIGKNCVVADYVSVGRGVTIGDNVKLENRTTVFEGVTLEDNVFVGPHVVFTNDLYPRSFNKDWKTVSTKVKQGSSIGAGSTIVCGVTIGEYSMIGAGSVVTCDVPSYALAFGNPARIRGFVCTCGRKLEVTKKNEAYVLMTCSACAEEFKIPNEDYSKIEKDD
ncbi:MAG: N-acetyltransferase [Candidatus Bathyarchaeum sp.]|nr:MAG: N-acetyltransferase [Candidatus Bathyarchaeum sp.]